MLSEKLDDEMKEMVRKKLRSWKIIFPARRRNKDTTYS